MKKTWPKKNKDAKTLVSQVVKFFEMNRFGSIASVQTKNGYEVVAGDSSSYKIKDDIVVTMESMPDELSLDFGVHNEGKTYSLPVILSTMFGGGYFLLKNLRSDEARQKVEREFWQYVDRIM